MFNGVCEFRGYESRTSGKGNEYINLFMETESGQSIRFYVGSVALRDYGSVIRSLEKGEMCSVTLVYHQGYNGQYQADFYSIERVS